MTDEFDLLPYLQGLPVMTLAGFEELVSVVSSLAMKGCLFLGELPALLAETEAGSNVSFLQLVSWYLY